MVQLFRLLRPALDQGLLVGDVGISCSCQPLNFSRALSEYVCDGIGWLSLGKGGGAGHWIATGGDTDGVEQAVTLSAQIVSSAAQSGFTGLCGILCLQLLGELIGFLAVGSGLSNARGFGHRGLVVRQVSPSAISAGPGVGYANLLEHDGSQ